MKPTESKTDQNKYIRNRRIVSGISLALFVVVVVLLTLMFTRVFAPYLHSSEEFHAFLIRYGWKGRLVLLGLQFLQVLVALIPGEIIELGAGYAYGAMEGLIICLIGAAGASSVVFLLTKKIGIPLVEAFISREKISQLRFINTETRLKRTIFLLFLIPGTPKDIFTYFAGLTDIRLRDFLGITLVARIPSILTSTISGQILGKEDYVTALIVYGATGIISLLGYRVYVRILKSRSK